MNIFFLDPNPRIAAINHCDAHVVKMILETAQMLCTAHRLIDGKPSVKISESGRKTKVYSLSPELDDVVYRGTHYNHPDSVWVRTSTENYNWAYQLFLELNEVYKIRFHHDKDHLSVIKLKDFLKTPPAGLKNSGFTVPPQCVAEDCIVDTGNPLLDCVEAYKAYYNKSKIAFANWRDGKIPDWFAPDVKDHKERVIRFAKVPQNNLDDADQWLLDNGADIAEIDSYR